MKRQPGFTLIELVVVIVILGVLAAIAVPRMVSLERESRIAVLDASRSALRSATTMVYATQATSGRFGNDEGVDFDGDGTDDGTVRTRGGYPKALEDSIAPLFDDLSDRFIFDGGGAGNAATIEMRLDGIDGCEVQYTSGSTAAGARIPPITAIENAEC